MRSRNSGRVTNWGRRPIKKVQAVKLYSIIGGESRICFPELLADLKKDPNHCHNLQHPQRREKNTNCLGELILIITKRQSNESLNLIFTLETEQKPKAVCSPRGCWFNTKCTAGKTMLVALTDLQFIFVTSFLQESLHLKKSLQFLFMYSFILSIY